MNIVNDVEIINCIMRECIMCTQMRIVSDDEYRIDLNIRRVKSNVLVIIMLKHCVKSEI